MQLKPLYIVRYIYPKGWQVELEGEFGSEEPHFYFAEGKVDGSIRGSVQAANHPRKRTDGLFRMDMQGFLETEDGAVLMVDYQGYGRAYPLATGRWLEPPSISQTLKVING